MRPIIGITVDCDYKPEDDESLGTVQLRWNYIQCIYDAGGAPILIPPVTSYKEVGGLIDGWLIPGGRDMCASRYGEDLHPEMVLQDPKRFEMESDLYKHLNSNVPILGVCYGCQFLNVIEGGSLIKHLPDKVGHIEHDRAGHTKYNTVEQADQKENIFQEYEVKKDSTLASILGHTKATGKCYHHQAVDRVGEGFQTVAYHADGTIEAIESTGARWMLGIQWHPERTPGVLDSQNIFKAFVEEARKYRDAYRR